jgi:hypothetical protein
MPHYIFLMHNDAVAVDDEAWGPYLDGLKARAVFEGGSEIGRGVSVRKVGAPPGVTEHVVGYIRVIAKSIEAAKSLLDGNPTFEAGGTVEIRELPRS